MSNALLEAMAAGRPIVATDVGANRRVLADGDFGVLVPASDASALAAAIADALDDWDISVQTADACVRHVRRHYSRGAMLQRFEQFYERLCA